MVLDIFNTSLLSYGMIKITDSSQTQCLLYFWHINKTYYVYVILLGEKWSKLILNKFNFKYVLLYNHLYFITI